MAKSKKAVAASNKEKLEKLMSEEGAINTLSVAQLEFIVKAVKACS